MLENIKASAAQPKNAGVFTVIWQGVSGAPLLNGQVVSDTYSTVNGTDYAILANGAHVSVEDASIYSQDYEDVKTFSTEVVPGQYGYLDVDDISEEEWGAIACGEQFDGSNEFATIDVLFVIDGGVIVQLEGKDN